MLLPMFESTLNEYMYITCNYSTACFLGSTSFHLFVLFSPFADQPNITDISRNTTVNQSDVVSLSCTADGNPEPRITWTRLSNKSSVTFPLNITGKQDEGYYRCTAENGIGNPASQDVFIHVQSKYRLVVLFF